MGSAQRLHNCPIEPLVTISVESMVSLTQSLELTLRFDSLKSHGNDNTMYHRLLRFYLVRTRTSYRHEGTISNKQNRNQMCLCSWAIPEHIGVQFFCRIYAWGLPGLAPE